MRRIISAVIPILIILLSFSGCASDINVTDKVGLSNDVKEITVNGTSGNIEIIIDETSFVEYSITGGGLGVLNPRVDISENDGKVTVSTKGFTIMGSINWDINIHLSKSDIDLCKINMTSGNASISGVNPKDFIIDITSGEVLAKEVNADELRIDMTSGEVTASGEYNNIIVDSTSGHISVNSNIMPDKTDIDITSGTVDLSIPENNGFKINFDKTSGNIKCDDFPLQGSFGKDEGKAEYKDGESIINIDMTSGTVSINKNAGS